MKLRILALTLMLAIGTIRAQEPAPEPPPDAPAVEPADAPEPPPDEAVPEPPPAVDEAVLPDEGPAPAPAANAPATQPAAQPAAPASEQPAAATPVAAPTPPPIPSTPPEPTDDLRLNFHGVPLDTVLDYLSQAAGFIIVRDAPIPGTVDIISHQPVTADEAVSLLHTVLNDRGYAVIRNDRILRIVKREDARTKDLPVQTGSDPSALPKSGEIVTQIVPIRHTNAQKLIETLRPLLPAQATITANEDSNSLVITDTLVNIRRMMEIIQALDTAVSSILDIKVIPLQYADATETADVINKIYETPTNKSSSNDANSRRAQFFSRMRGGMFGGGGDSGSTEDASKDVKQTANFVKAVAEEHGNSVVVTAPSEIIPQIQQLVKEIDIATDALTTVRVFPLRYSDATEMANVIAGLYPDTTNSNTRNQTFGGRGSFRRFQPPQQQDTSTTSERKQTEAKVIAVADTRTNSVIVSASAAAMENISSVIASLDSTPANVPTVYIYKLQNADVTTAKEILDNMYEDIDSSGSSSSRSSSSRSSTSSRSTSGTTRASSGTGTSSSSSSRNSGSSSR